MAEEEKAQAAAPETPAPIEIPTLLVAPTEGPLAGRTIRMRYPSTRYWMANERGQADNVAFYEEILDAIEDHDLGRDPASLPPGLVVTIGQAWTAALKAVAVPPTNGTD